MRAIAKVILITIFIFIYIPNPTLAQEGWFQQSIEMNFDFLSVHFTDNNRIKRKTLMLRKKQNLTSDNQHFNKHNLALLNIIS